jgi:predicted transcriptional regulator
MAGKNWYSETNEWKDLVKPETKAKAALAAMRRKAGVPVVKIAEELELSPGRIYQLLKT